jgi:hypothetical protein
MSIYSRIAPISIKNSYISGKEKKFTMEIIYKHIKYSKTYDLHEMNRAKAGEIIVYQQRKSSA